MARLCEVSIKDAAKACWAACVTSADHLAINAVVIECWRSAGAWRVLCCASRLMKEAVSSLHLPPTSSPKTTSLQRRLLSSSGYVFFSATGPAKVPPRSLDTPSRVSGEARVVSTASWFPPHSGNPFATTSIFLSSWRSMCGLLPFQRPRPRPQESRLCASRGVVAKRVQSSQSWKRAVFASFEPLQRVHTRCFSCVTSLHQYSCKRLTGTYLLLAAISSPLSSEVNFLLG